MTSTNFILWPRSDDYVYQVVLLIFATLGPATYVRELTTNLGYSKFFHGRQSPSVPSRIGMTMLYSPAFIASLYLFINSVVKNGNLTGLLLTLHFAKRLFESHFVHKYSGGMELEMVIPGSFYYTISAVAAFWYSDPAWLFSLPSLFGLVLFGIGMGGNYYHHVLLAGLRKPGEKKYAVPKGGMFELVACPHYFFEVIIWLGIAVFGRAALGYMPPLAFAGYLMGRSKKTTEYYYEKLGEEYPKDRKHMIPFVF